MSDRFHRCLHKGAAALCNTMALEPKLISTPAALARLWSLILVAVPLAAISARANSPSASEHMVMIANGEVVGTLDVKGTDDRIEVTYRVDNNGRGPRIDETLELDARGYPIDWSIRGASLFGAPVDESFRWRHGLATWRSQADAGSQPLKKLALYVGGDASPWAYGLYARALLGSPGHTLEVLPSGRMKLETLETFRVGDEGPTVTIYRLSGLQLDPQLIALDANRQLFASFGSRDGLIRKGYEAALPRHNERARLFESERLQTLQHRLAHVFDSPIRYRNVRVFDPRRGSTGERVSVLVRDGRIQAVDGDPMAGDPQAEMLVDGEGGTLVAGLYDMHSHSSPESGLFYLAAGVTSTRDMGNDNELLAEIIDQIAAGVLAGPRITRAGLIEARSPYSVRLGIVAETLDEALDAVRWYADHGYHEIKTYNSMNPHWVAPLAEEARRLGLGITGHVPAFMHPDQVILAGYDAIAHINQLMLGWLLEPGEDTRTPLRLTAMKRAATLDLDSPQVSKTVALMHDHGTALDTTAVILERLMLSRAGQVQPGDRPYLAHMPIGYQRYRKRTFVPLAEPGDDTAYREAFDRVLQVIKLLHDRGIPLLIGTDDATGFTVHRELELYVQAGVPPAAALSLASLGAAEYLGQQEQLGVIEPGKLADFLLVARNPAEDIGAIREVRLVSRGGTIYLPEEIYRELDIAPFAPGVAFTAPRGGG